ncbi:unnamed protein product, partial [Effrenium voratum]
NSPGRLAEQRAAGRLDAVTPLRWNPRFEQQMQRVTDAVKHFMQEMSEHQRADAARYLRRLLAGATEPGENCSTCYHQLCEGVAQDFLEGAAGFELLLRSEERQSFERCVLLLALSKRYRVEYGAHPAADRRMAVPYRAKDVAAERAEFGHPDVAILLSILTYYRGGLSDTHLDEVFGRLQRRAVETEAALIYEHWTGEMKDHMPEDLRKWSGVNLDNRQRVLERLYPKLRRHRRVVDFWLDEVVFPVEAKCFPHKIASTGWDLCTHDHVTTGFSGTNDTRLLLPLSIKQKDLEALTCTNGIVLRNLLIKDNNCYTALAPCEAPSGASLLVSARASKHVINVVLDAGAWVTDMSNEKFAHEWLKIRDDMEAVVFFGADNDILVMNHAGSKMPLATSPYESSLNKCLLYLDDIHTRGSDFRLAPGTHAAVTLGRRMQKDKLVQTCMRMRLLGSAVQLSQAALMSNRAAKPSSRKVHSAGASAWFGDPQILSAKCRA